MTYLYFDYAASSPPYPEALTVFKEVSQRHYSNPSSKHPHGVLARKVLDESRDKFRKLLDVNKCRIIATSCGTEANNLVLNSFLSLEGHSRMLIADNVHASSWYATKHEDKVDILRLNGQRNITIDSLRKYLSDQHRLVSIVHVNNETGIVEENLPELMEYCQERGIYLHIDGVQALGHIPVCMKNFRNVFYTFSAHKFGAPRGCGGIITSEENMLLPQLCGGGQESNLRAGTENVAALASAVAALEIALDHLHVVSTKLRDLSALFVKQITQQVPDIIVNSDLAGSPGLISLTIPGVFGSMLVAELGMRGIYLSAGSACHEGKTQPSRIIQSLGLDRKLAMGTIRVSLGYLTKEEEIACLVEQLTQTINRQKEEN